MSAWGIGILEALALLQVLLMVWIILFCEAVGLGAVKAKSCMFEVIFVSKGVPFFGAERLPIAHEHVLGGFKGKLPC